MSYFSEVSADAPIAYWRMADVNPVLVTTGSRTNLCTNPSLESAITGWSMTNTGFFDFVSDSRPTSGGFSGTGFFRGTVTFSGSEEGYLYCATGAAVKNTGYYCSVYVRPSAAGHRARLHIQFLSSNGSVISSSVSSASFVSVSSGVWTRLSQLATSPNSSSVAFIRAVVTWEYDHYNVGETLDADAALYEKSSTLGAYFDGASGAGYTWLGTAHLSASQFSTSSNTYPLDDSRNSYDGTYTSSGVNYAQTAIVGDSDKAAQFTTTGSATVPSTGTTWEMDISAAKRWTIEFLARFDSGSGGRILSTSKWDIKSFGSSLAFAPTGAGSRPGPTGAWTNGTWKHYAITFDGTNERWYINGSLVLDHTPGAFSASGAGSLVFAGASTAVTLDEVAIYNKALSTTRVQAHYNNLGAALDPYVVSIEVEPNQMSLQIGGTTQQQLTATAIYSNGTEAALPSPVWSTSDGAVASVNASGLVTAVGAGSAAITVSNASIPVLGVAGVYVAASPPEPETPTDIYSGDPTFPVFGPDGELIGTTEEYLEVDPGRLVNDQWIYDTPVSLATYAYNVSTIAGREGIPVADIENIRVATRAGREWIPKTPDQRSLTLAMWVQGTTEDGLAPTDVHMRTKFWENFNKLKKLFAVWDRQILIRRRIPTRFGIVKQEAFVEPASTMDISPNGNAHGAFSIDLLMADPFWYGDEERAFPTAVKRAPGQRFYPRTYPLSYGGGDAGASGIIEITNDGSHDARLVVEFYGPLVNPRLDDLTYGGAFRLEPDVAVEFGSVITVDMYERDIQLNKTGSRYWWLDRTTDWIQFPPGTMRLQFSQEGTELGGYVLLRWRPAYL